MICRNQYKNVTVSPRIKYNLTLLYNMAWGKIIGTGRIAEPEDGSEMEKNKSPTRTCGTGQEGDREEEESVPKSLWIRFGSNPTPTESTSRRRGNGWTFRFWTRGFRRRSDLEHDSRIQSKHERMRVQARRNHYNIGRSSCVFFGVQAHRYTMQSLCLPKNEHLDIDSENASGYLSIALIINASVGPLHYTLGLQVCMGEEQI